jgi:hypothetical protein
VRVFGVETHAWSQATTASPQAVEAALAALVDPPLRTWLVPGPLAPIARVRRDRHGRWLRLSPGDPKRGPGSLDRAYVTVRADGTGTSLEIAQRPTPLLGAILGAIVVGAWIVAILFALDGLLHHRPYELLGVLVAFGLRSFVDLGRRCDERRLRQWIVMFTEAAVPTGYAPRPRTVSYGPARFDVAAPDCG